MSETGSADDGAERGEAFRWRAGRLEPLGADAPMDGRPMDGSPRDADAPIDGRPSDANPDDTTASTPTAQEINDQGILAADSWLVDDGSVLALDLHRERFLHAVTRSGAEVDAEGFWAAVVSDTARSGAWFPRVELRAGDRDPWLGYRRRRAPERRRSAVLVSASGPDPRTQPTVKGPDLTALSQLRADARARGADEAVIRSPDGHVVEGAYSALLWWRGETLCAPSLDLERVDSVTARSVIALATALGADVAYESVEPAELDGLEIWVCSALHGLRIATAWIDGPQPAEEPGRLALWRARLGRLSRQVDTLDR